MRLALQLWQEPESDAVKVAGKGTHHDQVTLYSTSPNPKFN